MNDEKRRLKNRYLCKISMKIYYYHQASPTLLMLLRGLCPEILKNVDILKGGRREVNLNKDFRPEYLKIYSICGLTIFLSDYQLPSI